MIAHFLQQIQVLAFAILLFCFGTIPIINAKIMIWRCTWYEQAENERENDIVAQELLDFLMVPLRRRGACLIDLSMTRNKYKVKEDWCFCFKPGLHIVKRIASICLLTCSKEYITTWQVSVAKVTCKRLLLSKTCVTMWKNYLLIAPIILTASLPYG